MLQNGQRSILVLMSFVISILAGWRLGGTIAERYYYDNYVSISPWPQVIVGSVCMMLLIGVGEFLRKGGLTRIWNDIVASTRSIAQTIYWAVTIGMVLAVSTIFGGQIDQNMYGAISPLPQLISGLTALYLLAVLWKIIFMKNFDSHFSDAEISHKEHLYLPEMVFVHLRLPISRLFKFLYRGVKGWQNWAMRTVVVFIGGVFLYWFLRNSPAIHEMWRVWWPYITGVILAWYILSWTIMIGVRYRGSGIIVNSTGDVWVYEMRFLNTWRDLWPAPKAIMIELSQIDLRTLEKVVNLPFLETYVSRMDISYKNDPTVAATLRGITLIGLDNVASSSTKGRLFADFLKEQLKARIKAENTPPQP